MDIFNHAIAGAVAGAAYDHPFLGALVGVAPDLVLGPRRRARPTVAYQLTHSGLALLLVALIAQQTGLWWVFWCWFSHLYLDIPTHGAIWSPKIFYPCQRALRSKGEWEFFNNAWHFGLYLNAIWFIVWSFVYVSRN